MASPLDPTYGAMLIGLLFAMFFQGMLTLQTFIYYESFPNDSRRLKLLVAAVWILDVAHMVLIAQATYHYTITEWGNPSALGFSTEELDLHLAFIGLATITCQSFFLHRVWVFSNKNIWLTGFLSFGCLSTFCLDVTISAQISKVPLVSEFANFTSEVIALFSTGAAVDIMIALVLCYYLRKGRSGFATTNSILARVVQYAVATGLATSLLALACLIAYLARPQTFIFIAMHFSLGRFYTNALLATLNARQSYRSKLQSVHVSDNWAASRNRGAFGQGSQSRSDPTHHQMSVLVETQTNQEYALKSIGGPKEDHVDFGSFREGDV